MNEENINNSRNELDSFKEVTCVDKLNKSKRSVKKPITNEVEKRTTIVIKNGDISIKSNAGLFKNIPPENKRYRKSNLI